MWVMLLALTAAWRQVALYAVPWSWIPASLLCAADFWLYRQASQDFGAALLGGMPELSSRPKQRLVTRGIRARVRHPVYLAHLCGLLAWSVGSGLAVCYGLTAFAIIAGTIMIRKEDLELGERFGAFYRAYAERVPAVVPKLGGRL
jgi:protein-S-isoprenylcysteine O-methyltransferase Ste14